VGRRLLEIKHESFYGSGKTARSVFAKELVILAGRNAGATVTALSELIGLDPSTVNRRHDAATLRVRSSRELQELLEKALMH